MELEVIFCGLMYMVKSTIFRVFKGCDNKDRGFWLFWFRWVLFQRSRCTSGLVALFYDLGRTFPWSWGTFSKTAITFEDHINFSRSRFWGSSALFKLFADRAFWSGLFTFIRLLTFFNFFFSPITPTPKRSRSDTLFEFAEGSFISFQKPQTPLTFTKNQYHFFKINTPFKNQEKPHLHSHFHSIKTL